MGHIIQAFLVDADSAAALTAGLRGAVRIQLAGSLALVPLTDVVFDAAQSGREALPIRPFWKLTQDVLAPALRAIGGRTMAYLETEYFGGAGTQCAAVWRQGALVSAPLVGDDAINTTLRILGVARAGELDEFDTIGLRRFRSMDDLVAAADRA